MSDPTQAERELVEQFSRGMQSLIQAVPPAHRASAQEALGDLYGMLLALRRKIERLEARKVPSYKGHWTADAAYAEGDMASHGGSVWYAKAATTARPSTHSEDWTLAIKSGRDGRDGKDLRHDRVQGNASDKLSAAFNGNDQADQRRIRPVIAHPNDPDARPHANRTIAV